MNEKKYGMIVCNDCGADFYGYVVRQKRCPDCQKKVNRLSTQITIAKNREAQGKTVLGTCHKCGEPAPKSYTCRKCIGRKIGAGLTAYHNGTEKSPYYEPAERPDDEIRASAAIAAQRILNRMGIASANYIRDAVRATGASAVPVKIVNGCFCR